MKNRKTLASGIATGLWSFAFLSALLFCVSPVRAVAQAAPAPGTTFVHTALGGFILGYDIDQTGTEGLLSEAVALSDGKANVAVETFDQKTGKIVKIIAQQNDSKNDFVTLGISGSSVGLVEFEHVTNLLVDNRLYGILNPLNSNKVTGRWTPPLKKDEIIQAVAESQGSPNTAVMAFENGGNFDTFLFSTNVAANTFGPRITVSDPLFDFNDSPVMAYDSVTNEAVLGTSNGCPNCHPEIGVVDLASGAFREFAGLGFGFINGIAVDSEDGIVCTSTEIDFSVEFYNLATGEGIIVRIPGATNQAQSGQDVEYDPIHKLFLVGQEFSSSAPTGSSIQIFDTKGNFVEAVNGLSLPASPALLALHPSLRAGYVIVTPSLNELQSFTY
jgi:hypothetical protein